MKLFGNNWGVYPRRITIYLREKGIDNIELVPIDLLAGEHLTPEYRKINPATTVPALQLDDGGVIHQSSAIYEYLEEVFPTPNMIGESPRERGRTRDLLSFIDNCYFAKINLLGQTSPMFKEYFTQTPETAEFFLNRYNRAIFELEDFVSDGPFLAGERVTIADCSFFSLVQYAETIHGTSLPQHCVKLRGFAERFGNRPSAKMGADLPDHMRKTVAIR